MVRPYGVLRMHRQQEIRWDDLCALMNELVKGVLPVGPRLAPQNWPRRIVLNALAVTVDALAVAFHVRLLQIRRKAVQVLVVGQNRMALGSVEIGIPEAEQRHNNRNILREGNGSKVLVHVTSTAEQLFEVIHANRTCDGQ